MISKKNNIAINFLGITKTIKSYGLNFILNIIKKVKLLS